MREIKRQLAREQKMLDVLKKIIDIVEDVPPEKRLRVVKAAAILSGVEL